MLWSLGYTCYNLSQFYIDIYKVFNEITFLLLKMKLLSFGSTYNNLKQIL